MYLHVITHNDAALAFYARHDFRLMKHERHFYLIKGAHYDALALCLYVNGGRPPASAHSLFSAARALVNSSLWWCATCADWPGRCAALWRAMAVAPPAAKRTPLEA